MVSSLQLGCRLRAAGQREGTCKATQQVATLQTSAAWVEFFGPQTVPQTTERDGTKPNGSAAAAAVGTGVAPWLSTPLSCSACGGRALAPSPPPALLCGDTAPPSAAQHSEAQHSTA